MRGNYMLCWIAFRKDNLILKYTVTVKQHANDALKLLLYKSRNCIQYNKFIANMLVL